MVSLNIFRNNLLNHLALFLLGFGDFPEMTDHMNFNYQYWQEQQKLIDCKRKKPSLDSIKVELKESDEDSVFQSNSEETNKPQEVAAGSTS